MPFISALIGAIGAAAAAVGSFLAPLAGAFGGLGVIGKALLGIGLNLAASAIQRKLAKKNAKADPGGVDLQLQLGEDVPRKVMCGRFAVAGHLAYANSHGEANSELQQVFVLSHFYTTALDKVWIDGIEATLGDADAVKGRVVNSGDYAGKIWIKFYDGRQTAADPGLVAGSNPSGRWTADHIGWGVSYVIVSMVYDREKLASPPQFLFEGRGAPLYDLRKDSTVGGSGTHRWSDVSTWEYSANPALIDYCFRRGFSINDDDFCGMFMTASDLPLAKYATAANICDELVGLRTRYVCSIGLDCDAEHGDNIEAIMKSCGGIVVNAVDGSYPVIGTNQPIVAELTDDDLIVGAQVSFRRRRPMNEIVNSVSGTYPNPANLWSPSGYTRATDAATTAIDRRTLDVQINFETVPDGEQAAQLAAIYFSENRFEATAQITVRPRWQVLEAGDWIRWNSARYGNRVYMVTDAELASLDSDGPRNAVLNLQERDGSIYTGVGVTVPLIPLGPATPVYQAELQDFTVVAVTGLGSDTRAYPALRVSWAQPSDPTVAGAILQWRIKAQPEITHDRTVPAADQTIAIIADGVLSRTIYEVRHKIIADPPRTTAWSAWVEIMTGDHGYSDVLVGLAQVRTDVYELFAKLRVQVDELEGKLDLSAGNASADTAERFIDRRVITKAQGALSASVVKETQARIDGDSALASDMTLVRVTAENAAAAVVTESVARIDGDNALASSLALVQAKANDATATGLFKIEASAGAGAVKTAITQYIRATLADAYLDAGEVLEVYLDGGVLKSRKIIKVNQFVVSDGAYSATFPMVFEAGILKLAGIKVNWADIENASIGTAQIANAAITSAKIGYLEVDESNIKLSAIMSNSILSGTLSSADSTSWTTVATITLSNPSGNFILIDYSISQAGARVGAGTPSGLVTRLRRVTGDSTIATISGSIGNGVPGSVAASAANFVLDVAPVGNVTYAIEYQSSGVDLNAPVKSSGGYVKFMWGKR